VSRRVDAVPLTRDYLYDAGHPTRRTQSGDARPPRLVEESARRPRWSAAQKSQVISLKEQNNDR
jgi:hypothetical protein